MPIKHFLRAGLTALLIALAVPAARALDTFYFAATSYTATEGGSVTIRVWRCPSVPCPIECNMSQATSVTIWYTTNGHPYPVTLGDVVNPNFVVSIPAWSSYGEYTLNIADNAVLQYDRSITMNIGSGWVCNSVAQESTLRVLDNDSRCWVFPEASSILEGGTSGSDSTRFYIERDLAEHDLLVRYTALGTASPGTDYTSSFTGTVTMPAGTTRVYLPAFAARADSNNDPGETVVLRLDPGDYVVHPTYGSASVTILDDFPTVRMNWPNPPTPIPAVLEGGGQIQFSFWRSNFYVLSGPLVVNYSVSGTATPASDHSLAASGSVTIPAGQSEVTVTLTAAADAVTDDNETAIVMVTAGGYTMGTDKTRTVTILDDTPTVEMVASRGSMLEGGEQTTYTFVRSPYRPGASYPLQVNYSRGGTAASSTDYTGLSGSVTIPLGQSTVTAVATSRGDAVQEGDETIALALAGGNYLIGPNNSANVILQDDTPVVNVYVTNLTVMEGSNAVFLVSRSSYYSSGPSKTINYHVGGTAAGGTDYTPLMSGTLTMAPGVSQMTIPVNAVADGIAEGLETITVTLDPGFYVVGESGTAIMGIVEPFSTVTVRATDSVAAEAGANTGTFTVSRSGGTDTALTVQLQVAGTASPGPDYTALPASVLIVAGMASANITVAPVVDATTEAAETVVLNLRPAPAYFLGLQTNAVVTIRADVTATTNPPPAFARFQRGSGSAREGYSIVVPLDSQKGVALDTVDGNGGVLFPQRDWTSLLYHYHGASAANQSLIANRIPFNNPIAAFGRRVGGSPLRLSQSYSFGIYAGDPFPFYSPIVIRAYRQADGVLAGQTLLATPNPLDTSDWSNYATNGFVRTVQAFGLKTALRDNPWMDWGTEALGAYLLSHTADDSATNYYFEVETSGDIGTTALVLNGAGQPARSRLYTLEFEPRPTWRSIFIEQPHFAGQPLPPEYTGKTAAELLTINALVTNAVSLTTNACTNLNHSAELRRHPILDQFVADLNADPLALVNYVFNEIELTDAVDYNADGSISEESINLGGINRGAVATFLEGQGSPTEQCALLVYLLRQARVPATYVFARPHGLKLFDDRLSQLLRFQVRGAVSEGGVRYTTNRLISVNYPWVAAFLGGKWVHLFPWMKDTETVEGLDLRDYLPAAYPNAQVWVKDFVLGRTNITAFASPLDGTPGHVYPRWLAHHLLQSSPGISLDDLGVRQFNRRRLFARWEDFPRPTWVTNSSLSVESLGSPSITTVSPRLTNVFNTVSIEVFSVVSPAKRIVTPELRALDLHNRRFFLTHTNITAGHRLSLTLEPFGANTNGNGSFGPADTNLLQRQIATTDLDLFDDDLRVRIRHRRHRALTAATPLEFGTAFLGLESLREVEQDRPLRKGDLAAICLNAGRVTKQMLEVHAEALWNMERALNQNPALTNSLSPELYQGGLVHMLGMSYYERLNRFDDLNRRLHKTHNLSSFAMGLAKIGARRDTNGFVPSGPVDITLPNVDMFFQETAVVGNGTVRPDNGWDHAAAVQDYFNLSIADGSAQEHQAINVFFQQTNAVSTVRLLQLAQAGAATNGGGAVELTFHNYETEGERTLGGRKLKEHELWSSVTAAFESPGALHTVAWVTPGPIANESGSFFGMGALILSFGEYKALIGDNQNGAYGSQFPNYTMAVNNIPNITFGMTAQQDFTADYSLPTLFNQGLASDSIPTFNFTDNFGQLQNGALVNSPFQLESATQFGQTFGGSPMNPLGALPLVEQGGSMPQVGFWDTVGAFVSDPVNVLSGEFYVDAIDLSLPGPMPLTVRRNYSSHNLADNQLGWGWKYAYMPYLALGTNEQVIYAAEPDGAVVAYERTTPTSSLWVPTPLRNPLLNNHTTDGIGSVANAFLRRIARVITTTNTTYYLTNSDGGLRTFPVMTFNDGIVRTRPYLTRWQDNAGNAYTFQYGTNVTQPGYGEVRKIQSSNGTFLGFDYDVYGRIIESWTGDGRRLRFDYDQFGDLARVTLPDASILEYEYEHRTQSITNGAVVKAETYSTHLLVRENKPDGRVLVNEYDEKRRVTNQWATVGPDLRLVRNATFIYNNNYSLTNSPTNTLTGATLVQDVFDHTTRYDYAGGLITRIDDPVNPPTEQYWYADNATAPGYPRSLWKTRDPRGLWTEFLYDERGNVTNTLLRGDLIGDGDTGGSVASWARYNPTNNLPLETVNAAGLTNRYFYTNTWRLARVESWPRNSLRAHVVTNLFVYYAATNPGSGWSSRGLLQREVRAAYSADAATNDWTHDERGLPSLRVQPTGSTDRNVTNKFFHNTRGELVEQTDGAGRKTRFAYDARGNRIQREVFETNAVLPLAWEFSYFNANNEPTWSDGPRFDPEDYTWRDYDGAGRRNQEIRWRSQARADGAGVEAVPGDGLFSTAFFDHDGFGNLVRTVDPRGVITTNTYDAIGQLLGRRVLDSDGTEMTSESFAYAPGGKVWLHTSPLGGVTETLYTSTGQPRFRRQPDGSTLAWNYYPDGRPQREILRNGSYWESLYDDAQRKVTRLFRNGAGAILATETNWFDRRGNLLTNVNAEGHAFVTIYDDLDRVKATLGPAASTFSRQQAATNHYAIGGVWQTNVNALGERTVRCLDALGRETLLRVQDANGSNALLVATSYSTNHYAATTTTGSGTNAIVRTAFTDTFGQPVLSWSFPAASATNRTRQVYDAVGNMTSSRDELSQTKTYAYDALNRVSRETLPDGAITTYLYNPAGSLIERRMPRGLTWVASYDSANRIRNESLNGSGNYSTRSMTYEYYFDGPTLGLLWFTVDHRYVWTTTGYDDFLRVTQKDSNGDSPAHALQRNFTYDRRGLLVTNEQIGAPSVMPLTRVVQKYDAYGQATNEQVQLDGALVRQWVQIWDGAGRRTNATAGVTNAAPAVTNINYGFGYRANGALTRLTDPRRTNYWYTYADNGLLFQRSNHWRVLRVNQRDGEGRLLRQTTSVRGTNRLTEDFAWRANSTLDYYTATRADFTDARDYSYDSRDRLTAETYAPRPAGSLTNFYQFDFLVPGLSVLTRVGTVPLNSLLPPESYIPGTGGLDSFERPIFEQSGRARRTATGLAQGATNVTATLDGQPVSVQFDPISLSWRWWADLEVTPGPHTLQLTARHANGTFVTNATSTFVSEATSPVSTEYDGTGRLRVRRWRDDQGRVVREQSFTWDSAERLIGLTERDAYTNGLDWAAVYDGLGRRLRTTWIVVTNSLPNPASLVQEDSWFDPEVEFLEAGVQLSGAGVAPGSRRREWKVHGPDRSGRYGGAQGIGGLEATLPEYTAVPSTVALSDHLGNVLATFNPPSLTLNWQPTVTGYGPQSTNDPTRLSLDLPLAARMNWLGKRIDRTGFYDFGARPYDPQQRRFLAFDPLGFDAGLNPYGYCDGDPINRLDPDGRLASGFSAGWDSGASHSGSSGAFDAAYWMGGVLNGGAEGLQGGASITANTFTFGGLDALELTDSQQYQGWEYTGSRILSTTGRELLITAGTLGAAQAFRATGQAGYGLLAGAGEVYSTYQNFDSVATGLENISEGNDWGYLQLAGGALGLRGNFAAANELADGFSRGANAVIPDGSAYSVAFEMELNVLDLGRSRSVHFNRANAGLDSAIQADPSFASQMENLIPGVSGDVSSVGGRATPAGWIWHHSPQSGVMQLVPQIQHTPGSIFWGSMHPGGRGGYSIWAIPAGAPPNR